MAYPFSDKNLICESGSGPELVAQDRKMMFLVLSRATGHEAEIRAFRQKIGDVLQARTDDAYLEPLPHSFYLFAYRGRGQAPVGLIEFYFYDDAFTCYEDPIYSTACDLSKLGPMHELVHVRSLIVDHPQRAFLFVHLCSVMMEASFALGKRYMTVMTTDDQRNAAMHLYQDAGMTRLGQCQFQGGEQVLFGANLEEGVAMFSKLRRKRSFADVHSFTAQIAALRAKAQGPLLRAS